MLVAQNHQLLYNVIGDFMKKPELLAPAGSFESLIAAIEGGCDAVYLSGKLYGARSFANNFDNDELVKAINIAHLYGIKVYVTINTLIYEDEVFIDNILIIANDLSKEIFNIEEFIKTIIVTHLKYDAIDISLMLNIIKKIGNKKEEAKLKVLLIDYI